MSRQARVRPVTMKSRFWIVRVARGHRRLVIAAALGALVCGLMSAAAPDLRLATRLLIGWDAALAIYLAATALMMARASAGDIAKHAGAQDEGALAIMALTLIAVAASLVAIFAELAAAREQGGAGSYLLAIATVILSWLFTHMIFALHYAYEFYGDGSSTRGLDFPDEKAPDYWDFVYFAVVIGMTFQVSDVAISDRQIRRAATVHSLLSFFFNTTIIALTVNMAANAF